MYYIIYFLSILAHYIYYNHFITHNTVNNDIILFDIYNISKYNEDDYYDYMYDNNKNINDYTDDDYIDGNYINDYTDNFDDDFLNKHIR